MCFGVAPSAYRSCGTHFPIFWIFLMAYIRMEMAAWETLNCSASIFCDWLSSSSKRACIDSPQPSWADFHASCHSGQNCRHWTGETNLCMLFPIKHCPHRPPQAFNAIRQPIPSNWNRKAKFPVYAFFLAKARHDYERNVCYYMKLLMMCTG